MSDLSEESKIPGPHATVEDRFSYVLACARRVGFDWDFDALATQYYAHDFEPGSALALEQRLSRKRRLPTLLAQLRQCSPTWSPGQRRGYQDETLRAAEEICARECIEFHKKKTAEKLEGKDGDDDGAAMLEDHG
ncbi:572f3c0a-a4b0-4d84-b773-914d2d4e6420 [Thermothielavioides terrestris]|uniref:572f3c0a-a4b0-4d84-b773-914d2d4e6420 n=1 Tax=Thermothielavioides terrestris TaxID=2587410 RepID=A0A446BNS2_9PEZI|nr:572f3c0a-a4b0-4d84-b773-914d2d4e6420 [Thermothielavioides terrestris]